MVATVTADPSCFARQQKQHEFTSPSCIARQQEQHSRRRVESHVKSWPNRTEVQVLEQQLRLSSAELWLAWSAVATTAGWIDTAESDTSITVNATFRLPESVKDRRVMRQAEQSSTAYDRRVDVSLCAGSLGNFGAKARAVGLTTLTTSSMPSKPTDFGFFNVPSIERQNEPDPAHIRDFCQNCESEQLWWCVIGGKAASWWSVLCRQHTSRHFFCAQCAC